uniref:Kh domain containing RNA binding protein-nucleic acid binding, RNA binding, zinc ion binding n=1 Tax=Linum usitatissimum TaxID=4006 RepID=A0A165G0Z2_LINUS|nr:kh domain containing RNA binding protein- nucleic acid binding, RNA binding, zinc ion binding [Linum usitatissimum]
MDARKRARPDGAVNNYNGGFKKSRPEMDPLSTAVGSKSKPCTKFFSTAGCPFGDGCHFQHCVPGGYNAVSQIMNRSSSATPTPKHMPPPPQSVSNGAAANPPAIKNRMCNKYNSAEGCKFGDKCHFAHGEWELRRPFAPSHDNHLPITGGPGPLPGRIMKRMDQPPTPAAPPLAGFGDTATAKISVDASLAGPIIGKGGVNSKQICRLTGAKLSIRDHETDPNLRNIELEGTFDQIAQASAMVKEVIANIVPVGVGRQAVKPSGFSGEKHHPGSNYKTKICDNFTKGTCTFGQRCHFAHGAAELRTS